MEPGPETVQTLPTVARAGWPWKPMVSWTVKLGVTALLLFLVLRKVPLADLKGAFLQVDLLLAGASVILFLLLIVPLEAGRLAFAGRLLGEAQPPYSHWLRLYAESRPFGYLLPASAGAEGMIWAGLRRFRWRHVSCGFVVLLTRVIGMGIWSLAVALSLGGGGRIDPLLARAPGILRSPGFWAIGGFLVLAGAALLPLLARRKTPLPGLGGLVLEDGFWRPMGAMVALALLSAGIGGLAVMAASRAAGTPLSLLGALGFLAIFNFAMVVPISMGGFGLQEAILLALGLPLGFPAAALMACSAVIHAQRLGLALAGLGCFLADPLADLRVSEGEGPSHPPRSPSAPPSGRERPGWP